MGAGDGDGADDSIVRATGDLSGISVLTVLSGTVSVQNLRITGGATDAFGGGIFSGSGTVTFDADSRMNENTATDGGGIFNDGGTVTLASRANVTGNTPNNCAGASVPLCSG